MADLAPTGGRAGTRRLPPWAYGAVAAVVTLAVIAVVGLSLLGGSDSAGSRAEADGAPEVQGEQPDGGAPGTREGPGGGGEEGDGAAGSGDTGGSGGSGSGGSGRSGSGGEGGSAGQGQGAGATTTTAAGGGGGGGGGATATTATSAPGGAGASTTVPVTAPEEVDPAITEAFTQEYEARCREIWSLSMDGQLYDPEDRSSPYVVEDCLDQVDPDLAESYETEQEAAQAGREEAEYAAYLLTISGQLCYAGECWTYE